MKNFKFPWQNFPTINPSKATTLGFEECREPSPLSWPNRRTLCLEVFYSAPYKRPICNSKVVQVCMHVNEAANTVSERAVSPARDRISSNYRAHRKRRERSLPFSSRTTNGREWIRAAFVAVLDPTFLLPPFSMFHPFSFFFLSFFFFFFYGKADEFLHEFSNIVATIAREKIWPLEYFKPSRWHSRESKILLYKFRSTCTFIFIITRRSL